MTPRRPTVCRRARMARLVVLVGGIALAASACGSGPTQAETYCGEVQTNVAALEAPAIQTQVDIDATLELYRTLADDAPIAVQAEWQQLVQSLETAATVNPADPASVQLAADTARITESAAVRIQQYTNQICGVAIGQVPPVTDIVTATTLAPPDTATDGSGAGSTDDGA